MNKAKRILGLVSAILGILLGVMEIFITLVSAAELLEILSTANLSEEAAIELVGVFLGYTIMIALGIILIVFNAKLCGSPVIVNGAYDSRKGRQITTTVFLSIFVVIYAARISNQAMFSVPGFLLGFVTLVLRIVALCLKHPAPVASESAPVVKSTPVVESAPVKSAPVAEKSTPVEPSLAEKINELKDLKERGIISAEQYDKAVDEIVKNYAAK